MKTLIIYSSKHHGNTEKLVKRISEGRNIEIIKAEDAEKINLSEYDLIGFASGIDFGKFYPEVIYAAEQLPENKNVFALFTCASVNQKMGEQIREIAERKNCRFLGKYGCKGYNTYGPWKLVGGMNKNHPNEKEIREADNFIDDFMRV